MVRTERSISFSLSTFRFYSNQERSRREPPSLLNRDVAPISLAARLSFSTHLLIPDKFGLNPCVWFCTFLATRQRLRLKKLWRTRSRGDVSGVLLRPKGRRTGGQVLPVAPEAGGAFQRRAPAGRGGREWSPSVLTWRGVRADVRRVSRRAALQLSGRQCRVPRPFSLAR